MSYMSINAGASQIHRAAGLNTPVVKKAEPNSPAQQFQHTQQIAKEADRNSEDGKGRFIDVRA